LRKVPIIIHEQTCGAGRANRWASKFAKKIALARKGSTPFGDSGKCVIVGNPVLTQIAEIKTPKVKRDPATIYIVGGSRGSVPLNELMKDIIKKLLNDYIIIHNTGSLWKDESKKLKESLGKLGERYETVERIDPMQLDGVYKRADIIISRAGANTVSEIMIAKRPAILIPLPMSASYDQPANARRAQEYGIAKVLIQDELTPKVLLEEIKKLDRDWNEMVAKVAKKKSPDIIASKKLVDLIEGVVR